MDTIKENKNKKNENPGMETQPAEKISSEQKRSFGYNPSKKEDEMLRVENTIKEFILGAATVRVLKDINFYVLKGEFAMLMGPSGCGKSTLLHSIYGLEEPTQGRIFIDNESIWEHKKNWRAHFRNKNIGFIPQQAFWVKSLTVLENIAIPGFIAGISYKESVEKAYKMLELIQMEKWAHYRPFDLSGGQQQRIAFARAMILNPNFIIADEPTGNLDQAAGTQLMNLIDDFNKKFNVTVLMVTHNTDQISYATRVVKMLDGEIISNEKIDKKQNE